MVKNNTGSHNEYESVKSVLRKKYNVFVKKRAQMFNISNPLARKAVFILSCIIITTICFMGPDIQWDSRFDSANEGEAILYPEISKQFHSPWFMPMTAISQAFYEHHLPKYAEQPVNKAIAALLVLLCFSCAWNFAPQAGILSAGTALFILKTSPVQPHPFRVFNLEQTVFSIALLFLMNILAMPFKSARVKNLLIGMGLAICIYIKTVIILFPLILLAYDLIKNKQNPFKETIKNYIPMAIFPVIALGIWISSQFFSGSEHVFILESTDRRGNITTGAAGIIYTTDNNYASALNIPHGKSALMWSAEEILRHPFRYIKSAIIRLYEIFFNTDAPKYLPILLLIALFAAHKTGTVWLLPAYFLTIHCMMAIETRYFIPLFFMLCPIAGAIVSRNNKQPEDPFYKFSLFLISLPLLILFIISLYKTAVYPIYTKTQKSPTQIALENPAIPWLWEKAGDRLFQNKDFNTAVKYFEHAYTIYRQKRGPNTNIEKFDKLVTAILLSDNYKRYRYQGMPLETFVKQYDQELTYVIFLADMGKIKEARKTLTGIKNRIYHEIDNMPCISPEDIKAINYKRKRIDFDTSSYITNFLSRLPAQRRQELTEKLAKVAKELVEPDKQFH